MPPLSGEIIPTTAVVTRESKERSDEELKRRRHARPSEGSPNRNHQVESQLERQEERQVDDLFGSNNRQLEHQV